MIIAKTLTGARLAELLKHGWAADSRVKGKSLQARGLLDTRTHRPSPGKKSTRTLLLLALVNLSHTNTPIVQDHSTPRSRANTCWKYKKSTTSTKVLSPSRFATYCAGTGTTSSKHVDPVISLSLRLLSWREFKCGTSLCLCSE